MTGNERDRMLSWRLADEFVAVAEVAERQRSRAGGRQRIAEHEPRLADADLALLAIDSLPEGSKAVLRRHERQVREPDDDEVEDVPAVPEELPRARPVRGDADHELDHEHADARGVHEIERRAPTVDDLVVRLKPEHDCVDRDRRDHDDREGRGVHEPGGVVPASHGRKSAGRA